MSTKISRFILLNPNENEEYSHGLRNSRPLSKTMELHIPKEDIAPEKRIITFFEKHPAQDELHPLRKQYLENRLQEISYQERQQALQDDFTTRMYGTTDYQSERDEILAELKNGISTRGPGEKYSDRDFLLIDRQNAQKEYPHTPPIIGEEISRFKREQPEQYAEYMKELVSFDANTWRDIDKDINSGKTTPQQISNKQWNAILETSANDLREKQQQSTDPYCNIYARDRLLQDGIYMPPDQNANTMKDYFESHSQTWEKIPKKTDEQGRPTKELNHLAAQEAAANGDTVIVTYKNPDNAQHGHVAIVNGEKGLIPKDQNKWKTEIPFVDGYNASSKKIGVGEALSQQLSRKREPDMDYYRYIGKKRNK